METEFKDYYAALGLSPDADDQAIKRTYRKLAREYHPDRNPGDTKAEERFKEINEAYQVLGDQEKRKKYDALRQQYQQWQQRGSPGGGFNWSQWQAAPGEGNSYSYNVSPEDLEDLFGEASPFSDFFSAIFGQSGPQGYAQGYPQGFTQTRTAPPRRGRDVDVNVELTLEEAFHGTVRAIQAANRRIEARIPRGVRTGSRVRLAGQGSPGAGSNAPAGDIYLNVQVLPHPRFERDGDDLRCELPIDIYTAIIGGEVRVQTIDGSVMLKIPPQTQADRTFRLRGRGMPRLDQPEQRGDLYAKAKLVLPDQLSQDEIETLRSLALKRQNAA
jgi:curved DNA-binding protein